MSEIADFSPAIREALVELGKNQGTQNPDTLPGRPQVWKVDGIPYVVYFVPGSDTPLVWQSTNEEIAKAFSDDGSSIPTVDKNLTGAQFRALAPVLAGQLAELRNPDEEPWRQFMSDLNESAELRPWMRDPEILAISAVAFLEGREVSVDELSKTKWWDTHTAAERSWMEESATLGTAEIAARREDRRREITTTMLELGLTKVPSQVIGLLTDKSMNGEWSMAYVGEQIKKLADPYAVGQLDPWINQLIINEDDGRMTRTRQGEDRVQALATQWLGPVAGRMSQQELAKWSGWFRNDPDAEINFVEHLKKQRLAMFPKYTNENLTYEDIVSPFRNLAESIWGQPVKDETMLIDLANIGDYTKAAVTLRKEGLKRGVDKTTQDAMAGLMQTGLGDQVQRSAI